MKLTGDAQFWIDSSHFISRFCLFSHFWGYTDMRWLCSICNVHIFEDFFPCHVWCPFDEKPHMSKKSRHSIRGRRVDPWQKRCHRHWLWLWISENSGNWWDLIHSDIYIYTYHTITLPYITLHTYYTYTYTYRNWMNDIWYPECMGMTIGYYACVIFTRFGIWTHKGHRKDSKVIHNPNDIN